MKRISIIYALGAVILYSVGASEPRGDVRQLKEMREALDRRGFAEFIANVSEHRWQVPHIPSEWHVEKVASQEEKEFFREARAFGKLLALRLADCANRVNELPAGEELLDLTTRLLDLAEWCWGEVGYGNFLLAERVMDLAAVGTARLAYDETFPIEKCVPLAARLEHPWLEISERVNVLNREYGEKVIPDTNDLETIDRVFGTGAFYRAEQKNPRIREHLQIPPGPVEGGVETVSMKKRLTFFEDTEPSKISHQTLLGLWDEKTHRQIGVAISNHRKIAAVKGFVAYRQLVGHFPLPRRYTEAEIAAREQLIKEKAKEGIWVAQLNPDPVMLGRAGFLRAINALTRPDGVAEEEWNQLKREQGEGWAWDLYNQIQKGGFVDNDTLHLRAREEEIKRRGSQP